MADRSTRARSPVACPPDARQHVIVPRRTDPARAVAYLRASTCAQRHTLDVQRERIGAWAAAEGVALAGQHVDAGVSGCAPLARRPGLADALVDLETTGAGLLVVTDRSRLARTSLDAALLDREVGRLGARVHCIDAGGLANDDSAEGRFVRQVLDAVNELEVARTRARTAAILRHKRATGQRTGGRLPYGYRPSSADPTRLEPHPEEQRAIGRIRQLAATGASQRAIVQALEQERHPARGAAWHRTTVARILARVEAAP